MRLKMLGCGHAMATRLYNTCFVLQDDGFCLLTDAGGGNQVLSRLEQAKVPVTAIHHLFVTHAHMDHVLGVPWVIRAIVHAMQTGTYEGELYVLGADEPLAIVEYLCERLLRPRDRTLARERVRFTRIESGVPLDICGHALTPFDIASTKATQFGYRLELGGGETLTCLGDEPLTVAGEPYARGATWLLAEAFCLKGEADVFRPYEKHHSTATDAARDAERMGARNLILYHSEDTDPVARPARYAQEARLHFSGNVFVPTDLDEIDLAKGSLHHYA